jgi:hypothetical protein
MTIVLICIVVAVGLAIVGGYLLVSGRREERSEVTGGASPPTSSYRAPGPAPVRVHRNDPEVGQPTQAHPAPDPYEDEVPYAPQDAPIPAPATAAAAQRPAPREPVRSPLPEPSTPNDGAVRAAGHARLEAALARARARLDDEAEPAEH